MTEIAIEDFAKYLSNKNLLPAGVVDTAISHFASSDRSLRKLWETTELTANGFADEVARFYGLKRLTLPQLVAATSLAARFSPRFLRDTVVFPFESPKGHYRLAVADPSDTAAVHAAEIVLGGAVAVEVASFEDIATVLGEQLGGEETGAPEGGASGARAHGEI